MINLIQRRFEENKLDYKIGYLDNNYFVTYESVKMIPKYLK